MPDFRKLAAIDIVFFGYTFVLAEYVCGIVIPIGLGILTLLKGYSAGKAAIAVYLISLGIDYVPMLIYTISIANCQRARAELREELTEQPGAMVKYRKRAILLLVPFFVPIVAISRRKI